MDCRRLDDLLPELGLDLLTGAERADALLHIQECAPCQSQVAAVAAVADEILLLAPAMPPPPGFDTVVRDRIAAERAVEAPSPGRRRWGWRVATAALVLVIATVMVFAPFGEEPALATTVLRTGMGEVVGEARLQSGDPGRVVVTAPGWSDLRDRYGGDEPDYLLSVSFRDGSRQLVPLAPAVSTWDVRMRASPGEISSVAIVDEGGRVWCSGTFE